MYHIKSKTMCQKYSPEIISIVRKLRIDINTRDSKKQRFQYRHVASSECKH